MANALGELFTNIANSIRGGLGEIGKMSPNTFPGWIDEIVAMVGTGETGGDGGESTAGELKIASGTFSVDADGTKAVVEHGLGSMPDLVIVQLPQLFAGSGTQADIVAKVPLVAAWGMKSTFDNEIRSGKVTSVYGLTSPLGIDNMSASGAQSGYISCPDETTFCVGATGDKNSKLYTGNNYEWLAISGIGSGSGGSGGSGGSSADVRYVTFMSSDGLTEYGKKPVIPGDDSGDPITAGYFDTPTMDGYVFYAWTSEPNGVTDPNALKNISEDRTVYAVFIPSGTCGENANWVLYEDGELVISGTGAIADYSYGKGPGSDYINSIKKITIQSGITQIGKCAFSKYLSATSITLPEGLEIIGSQALQYSGINSVTIPNSVTKIGTSALNSCYNVTSVTIPDNVTAIGDTAFSGSKALKTVVIGSSVTTIGRAAFDSTALTSATFKDTTTWTGTYLSGSTQSISSSSLANKSTAATYLKTTYVDYTWTKS